MTDMKQIPSELCFIICHTHCIVNTSYNLRISYILIMVTVCVMHLLLVIKRTVFFWSLNMHLTLAFQECHQQMYSNCSILK